MDSGREDCLMEKVSLSIIKLGTFKVKGEKSHTGIFEDNVLVSEVHDRETKREPRSMGRKKDSSLILAMIPEMTTRSGIGDSEPKRKNRRKWTPASTAASYMTPGNSKTWRSRMQAF